jgi:hypothetical protein
VRKEDIALCQRCILVVRRCTSEGGRHCVMSVLYSGGREMYE